MPKINFLKFFKFEGDPVAVVVRLRLGPVPVVVAPSGCVFYPVAVCGSGSGFRVSCYRNLGFFLLKWGICFHAFSCISEQM